MALLLVRPQPVRQLLAFLTGSFLTSASVGILVLYVLGRGTLLGTTLNGAKAQIVIGALAISVALLLATKSLPSVVGAASVDGSGNQTGLAGTLSTYVGKIVQGSSPWFAAALGVGIAVPSIDYLALLVLIAASGLSLSSQAVVLLTFLTIANAILLVPIASYLVKPQLTEVMLGRLRDWVLSRRQRDYAALLGVIGCVMIAMGVMGL